MPEPSPATLPKTWSTRFELRGELGTGSMGVVHRVLDRQLGREVALKTLRANTPDLFLVLKEEFRAAASVVHPNLVELYELFVEGERCFFTMELLDAAVPFGEWIRPSAPQAWLATIDERTQPRTDEHRAPPWAESGTIRIGRDPGAAAKHAAQHLDGADAAARLTSGAAQLFRALCALHDAGRVHCDLKPSNILVAPSGRLCVLDFGLSAPLWGQLARLGFSGTLAYAAPEQLWGGDLTPATDWYSLGVVLFEALTGSLPEGEAHLAATLELAWGSLDEATRSGLPERFDRLVAALLRLDPAERPTRGAIARVLDPAAEPRETAHERPRQFVGRDLQLAALHDALRTARGGLTVVDVRGESGMGKTELIRQFTRQAIAESALVARGQCRLDESVAYQAIDQVIDDLSRHLMLLPAVERQALLPDDFSSLVRVFPVLGRLATALDPLADVDTVVLRQRALVALQQLLARLGAWRPLILWVDDAQWGDAESQSLIVELLRGRAPPLLLILSHRDPLAPWLQPIAEAVARVEGRWVEVAAGPLDGAASAALAASLLGELAQARPRLLDWVTSECDGVPIFIGQLCRLITEAAQPERFDSEPLRFNDIIERRVAGLDPDERRLAELAALIQTPLPVDVVIAAAGLDQGRGRVVSRLAAAQLLRVTGQRKRITLTSFHEHVRQSILSRLEPTARQRSHGLLARTLEQLAPTTPPEVLLHHWLEAGELQPARAAALRAADAAMAQLAFNHAAALYRSVLDQLESTHPDHATIQAKLAAALSAAGRAVEAGGQYRELSLRTPPPASLRLEQLAAEHFLTGGALEEGLAVLKQALSHVGLSFPGSTGHALLHGLRHALLLALPSPFPPAQTSPERRLQIDLCLSAAKGLGVVDPILSLYFALTALRLAARASDPSRLATAQCLSGCMLACAGGPPGRWGRRLLSQAARFANASDDSLLQARALACQAQVDLSHGRWSAVLHDCQAAQRFLETSTDASTWERNLIEVAALRALEEHGQLARSWQRARDWRADAHNRGDLYAQTTADLYLAFACLGHDDPHQAEQTANLALARWGASPPPFQHLYRLRLLAYAELYRRRPRAAQAHHDQAQHTARKAGVHRFPPLILDLSLLDARINLQLARSGDRQALASSVRSIQRIASLGREDAAGHASLLRAGVAAVRGQTHEARRHLALAREQLGAVQLSLGVVYSAAAEAMLEALPHEAPAWKACLAELDAQGIRNPRAWLGVFAPGFVRA